MLHDVGGVGNHPRNYVLARLQLDRFPHLPFMLVTRIGGLEAEAADPDLEHQIYNLLERNIEHVGSVPASPTDVVASALQRQPLQCAIERSDVHLGPLA